MARLGGRRLESGATQVGGDKIGLAAARVGRLAFAGPPTKTAGSRMGAQIPNSAHTSSPRTILAPSTRINLSRARRPFNEIIRSISIILAFEWLRERNSKAASVFAFTCATGVAPPSPAPAASNGARARKKKKKKTETEKAREILEPPSSSVNYPAQMRLLLIWRKAQICMRRRELPARGALSGAQPRLSSARLRAPSFGLWLPAAPPSSRAVEPSNNRRGAEKERLVFEESARASSCKVRALSRARMINSARVGPKSVRLWPRLESNKGSRGAEPAESIIILRRQSRVSRRRSRNH